MHYLMELEARKATQTAPSRRQFIQAIGLTGGALLIGVGARAEITADSTGNAMRFNAFIKISADSQVTILVKHLDFGQGVITGLATIVAEELDADWQQMTWEFAPADALRYNNLLWGPFQGTGGSTSIANSWQQLRLAGAATRQMFVNAAAKAWKIPADQVRIAKGVVSAGQQQASFGELLALAAAETPSNHPPLKNPSDFTLIGKTLTKLESNDKIHGKAVYTSDLQLPDMLTALVLFPPKLGATLKNFDDSAAKKIAGFVRCVALPRGVAVVANGFWAAKSAREQITANWDLSACETRSSEAMFADYARLAEGPGTEVKKDGDSLAAMSDSALKGKHITAEYRLPYLAHAPMEPMSCIAKVTPGHCELWYGAQIHTHDQNDIGALLGIAAEKVTIHTQLAGGSFGRRACTKDYVYHAVDIARQLPGRPIKLLYSREDDIRGGFYRPMAVHKVQGKVSSKGDIQAWHHHAVAQPIFAGTPLAAYATGPVEPPITEGLLDLPYRIQNLGIYGTEAKTPITGLWWRSVGHSGNAFVVETFIDQLAEAAHIDPLAFRRQLLKGHTRWLDVLNLAAEKSDWGTRLGKDKARGIAVHKAMGSWVAQVAEITRKAKTFTVDRVVCAIDCGLAINPDNVRAQMEGSIGFALGAVFGENLTLNNGAVVQDNFHTYTPLRFHQMPKVEVHIVPSAEPPTGVGEPGVPPLTPAVANAVFALTGKPVTSLPITLG